MIDREGIPIDGNTESRMSDSEGTGVIDGITENTPSTADAPLSTFPTSEEATFPGGRRLDRIEGTPTIDDTALSAF